MKRKGFHGCLWVALLLCLGSVNAEESAGKSADDIIAMMSWWDEYGRYWDEMGVSIGREDDMTFALLAAQGSQKQEVVQ